MTRPVIIYPDVERLVVDWLTEELAANGESVTVGVPVPATWKHGSTTHVQVAVDGHDTSDHPVWARATVRVTVWDDSTTDAKRIAWLCHGFLLTQTDAHVRPLTGVLPTQDTESRAQLATFTVLVSVRSTETYNS